MTPEQSRSRAKNFAKRRFAKVQEVIATLTEERKSLKSKQPAGAKTKAGFARIAAVGKLIGEYRVEARALQKQVRDANDLLRRQKASK